LGKDLKKDHTPRAQPRLLEGARQPLVPAVVRVIPAVGRVLEFRIVKRFRAGLVFEAHRLCVSLNSMLESNKEEGELPEYGARRGVRAREIVRLGIEVKPADLGSGFGS